MRITGQVIHAEKISQVAQEKIGESFDKAEDISKKTSKSMLAQFVSLIIDTIGSAFAFFQFAPIPKDNLAKRAANYSEQFIDVCAEKTCGASKRGFQQVADYSVKSSSSLYNSIVTWIYGN